MNFIVINAHESSAEQITNLAERLKLNEYAVTKLIDSMFPWVSFYIVDEKTFIDEYLPKHMDYYFTALSN